MINRGIKLQYISFLACMLACLGDFAITFILGLEYPGYNGLRDSMSILGSPGSPVAILMSIWWIILFILLNIFALGFLKTFSQLGRPVKIAAWLIIIYGVGEGLGSAIFPLIRVNNELTLSGIFHVLVGSIGDMSLLIMPLVIAKVFSREFHPRFNIFSILVMVFGSIMILFFIADHMLTSRDNIFVYYKGLWQRLFLLDYYFYLMVIGTWMIRPVYYGSKKQTQIHPVNLPKCEA